MLFRQAKITPTKIGQFVNIWKRNAKGTTDPFDTLDVFGDYAEALLYIPKDSVDHYKQKLSKEYLPYGITTALMMGHPENWLDDIIQWKDGNSLYTDYLTCGGALISKEEREPYKGHLTVESESLA